MKLTAFRVMNYRCVNDSGWVDVDRLTVLVGKNQSGKSALLRALHKFNPFQDEPYNMDREWPRGRRKDRDTKAPAVKVRFAFSEEERKAIHELTGTQAPNNVEISHAYDSTRVFTFSDSFRLDEPTPRDQVDLAPKVQEILGLVDEECSPKFKEAVQSYIEELEQIASRQDIPTWSETLRAAGQRLDSTVSTEEPQATTDQEVLKIILQNADAWVETLPSVSPILPTLEAQITQWLPVFVYMDDYRRYIGSTFLNQLEERRDNNQLTEEDETVLILMEMAGLSLDDQIAKVSADDREQRALDLNDASITLTDEMSGRWSQAQYIVQFHADQHHFMTFVRSPGQSALVPLEEESRGFQWFFSFDLHFAYETQGTLKDAIILLDEPGLHLHPTAQTDLMNRLEAYCEGNQLIYTTHLPFMIDLTRPERIRVVDRKDTGTEVTDDIFSSDEDARFTLLAKLGMSASQSLLVNRYNLVVEGVDDYWFVTNMSEVLKRTGKQGLDDRVQVTASGGASEAAYIATFMCGQDLNVAVLFDSDRAGESAEEALVKKWLARYRSNQIDIIKVGDLFAEPRAEATIEDLLTEDYCLPFVQIAFQKELGTQMLSLRTQKEPKLVQRLERALRARGIDKFNKGRPAKLIRDDLRVKRAEDLPDEVVQNFERLFARLAEIVSRWDTRGGPND